ncbi:L,D-peptidoglycan transpeptidase YkuD (ErfK/YbiS/YcfS/YnhG family) [Streptacidiphilus sp. MAP12-16]|jgi:L,D-peptidoglycan transpeptidase YkuD (ErfK/YbiS/YcfS/YnhG family)|uniref:L,D-transpeptidase family protein n=1 Tax=Streptacidiphilus sp. MAP12-16 TaxID=3156300 RepID=UPI003519653B
MSSHSRSASGPHPRRTTGAAPGADDGGHGSAAGSHGNAYGNTFGDGYASGYEQVEYGQSGHGQSGYEQAPYEQADYGQPGYEQAGYEAGGYAEPEPDAAPRGSRSQARAASRARARRKRRLRTGFLGVGSVAAVAVIAVAGFLHPDRIAPRATAAAAPAVNSARIAAADTSRSTTRATPDTSSAQLPGLGPVFRAKVPANADQVLLVTGSGKGANTAVAVLYTRTADGNWLPGTPWAAHNARDGWTTDHHEGDLHSPIGVFTLTDAGGLDPNPGTKLPYLHSSAFQAPGTGFEGESLADAFDYVVAINYNHVPGTSPLSELRPMGVSRGGGIWVHVDHGGPTHGCVSLAKANMATLLRDLDPAKHPVIVMGDATSLKA